MYSLGFPQKTRSKTLCPELHHLGPSSTAYAVERQKLVHQQNREAKAAIHHEIMAKASDNDTETYLTTEDWIKSSFAHIHTDEYDNNGNSIMRLDGDQVIANALRITCL
jgi:hypothetical protein